MNNLLIGAVFFASFSSCFSTSNLTCYQCVRNTEKECGPEDLKPCGHVYDRCAIHFTKNSYNGFSIKRECGLAPCGFDDEMVVKGLGMNCDRNKDEYSCTLCCKGNGCNKSGANVKSVSKILHIFAILVVCLINVARDFIPPFVMTENINFKK